MISSNQSATTHRTYRTFKCHRLVLSAYSDFFRQCFLDSAKSNVASLFLDIEPRTLENILRLIYFGQIEIIQSDIELFFNAATKLSLKEFKIANSNEVFNVDSDLNHLKRRLTQDETSQSKSSKQLKDKSREQNGNLQNLFKRQFGYLCFSYQSTDTLNEGATKLDDETQEPLQNRTQDPGPQGLDHAIVGLVNTSVPKLNFPSPIATPPEAVPAQADGINPFTCSICNKQYSYKISLNKHIKSAHSN